MKSLQVFNICNDIIERAIKTFVQVLLVGLPVDAVISGDVEALKVSAVAAAAAALSVLMNAALAWAKPETGGSAL